MENINISNKNTCEVLSPELFGKQSFVNNQFPGLTTCINTFRSAITQMGKLVANFCLKIQVGSTTSPTMMIDLKVKTRFQMLYKNSKINVSMGNLAEWNRLTSELNIQGGSFVLKYIVIL